MTPERGDHADPELSATFEGYAVAVRGAVVLASQQACQDVLRSLKVAIEDGRRKGHAPPLRALQLVRLLSATLDEEPSSTSGSGSPEVPQIRSVRASLTTARDVVGVQEAARMLGVSDRQVRNLVPQLRGEKVRRSWVFDRFTIEAAARRRATGKDRSTSA